MIKVHWKPTEHGNPCFRPLISWGNDWEFVTVLYWNGNWDWYGFEIDRFPYDCISRVYWLGWFNISTHINRGEE